jgi:hypothetical protein
MVLFANNSSKHEFTTVSVPIGTPAVVAPAGRPAV